MCVCRETVILVGSPGDRQKVGDWHYLLSSPSGQPIAILLGWQFNIARIASLFFYRISSQYELAILISTKGKVNTSS